MKDYKVYFKSGNTKNVSSDSDLRIMFYRYLNNLTGGVKVFDTSKATISFESVEMIEEVRDVPLSPPPPPPPMPKFCSRATR